MRLAALPILLAVVGCSGHSAMPTEARELRDACHALRRTLFEDPVVRSFMIYPYCTGDRVTLRGSVRDYDGYLEAERITREQPWVRSVTNDLEILEEDEFTPRNR